MEPRSKNEEDEEMAANSKGTEWVCQPNILDPVAISVLHQLSGVVLLADKIGPLRKVSGVTLHNI